MVCRAFWIAIVVWLLAMLLAILPLAVSLNH